MLRPLVAIDLVAGRATLAGTTVLVRARSGGALEFEGCVIRPLRFGERWRLLEAATMGGALGASVLATATDGDGARDAVGRGDAVAQALALHMAGARADRAVPGCAAQLSALIGAGWTARDVLDADADLIDLITADVRLDADRDAASDGWTSIQLAPRDADDGDHVDGPDDLAPTVTVLVRMLERQLLGRIAPVELAPGDADSAATSQRAAANGDSADSTSGGATPATDDASKGAGGPAGHRAAPPARTPVSAGRDAATHPGGPSSPEPAGAGVVQRPVYPQPIRTEWPGGPGWVAPTLAGAPGAAFPLIFPTVRYVGAPALASSAPPAVAPASTAPSRSLAPRAAARSAVIEPDAAVRRTAPFAAPAADGAAAAGVDAFAVADEMAVLLDEESDLRGLRR